MADKKKDRYNEPFPVKLRGLMNNRHVTQQVLVEAIGVKRQTISAYSDGSTDPTLSKLSAMTDYFMKRKLWRSDRPDLTRRFTGSQASDLERRCYPQCQSRRFTIRTASPIS